MTTKQYLHYEIAEDQTGTLFLHDPFDPLDLKVQSALRKALKELAQKKLVGLLLCSSNPLRLGCDTRAEEVLQLTSRERAQVYAQTWQQLTEQLHALPYTVVCALPGDCWGMGLELALACDWRIGTPTTQVGFLEIQAGTLPKAGSLYRLPRLIGLQAALDLLLTGRTLSGSKAHQLGLLHLCVPTPLVASQCKILLHRVNKYKRMPASVARASAFSMEGNPLGRKLIFKKTRELIGEKTQDRHPAAYHCLDAVAYGFEATVPKALEREAELFAASVMTREAQGLSHQLRSKKQLQYIGLEAGSLTVGLLGAVLQSGDVALRALEQGHRVLVYDEKPEAIGIVLRYVYDALIRKVDRKELTTHRVPQYMARVSPCRSRVGFSACDVVMELGQMPAKIEVAGTTVSLYFLAAPSSFVEVCLSPSDVDATPIFSALHRIGKPALSLACEGPAFLPQIEGLFFSQALYLTQKGILPAFIDQALEKAGFRMGPFRWMAHKGHPFEAEEDFAESEAPEWKEADVVNRFLLVLFHGTCAHIEQYPQASLATIDVLLVEGLGFPEVWGGILKYADWVGIRALIEGLTGLAHEEGLSYAPSAWLQARGKSGEPFFG